MQEECAMKKILSLVVAVATIPVLVGSSLAQSAKPAAPAATAPEPAAKMPRPEGDAAKADKPAVTMKTMSAEIVSMDQASKVFTVKHMVEKKSVQVTFSVDESGMATLAKLKPCDHVKVTYEERGDTRIARSIVKG